MVYGLVSDIHGNLEALTAVLAEMEGISQFLCLGDIVGYGADPGECVDRVRELPGLVCVAGNHDLAAIEEYDQISRFNPFARDAIEWTRNQLSAGQRSYLASLQRREQVEEALLVHGSLPDEMAYITAPHEARQCFEAMPGDLTFVGHTHVTEYYRVRDTTSVPEQVSLRSGGRVALESGLRCIVNPGAVGQPRDGNAAASFGIWDSTEATVEVRRVGYDVERAQEKMQRVHLPEHLIVRLAEGR